MTNNTNTQNTVDSFGTPELPAPTLVRYSGPGFNEVTPRPSWRERGLSLYHIYPSTGAKPQKENPMNALRLFALVRRFVRTQNQSVLRLIQSEMWRFDASTDGWSPYNTTTMLRVSDDLSVEVSFCEVLWADTLTIRYQGQEWHWTVGKDADYTFDPETGEVIDLEWAFEAH